VLTSGQHAVELALAAGVRVGFGTDLMGALEDEQLAGLRLQSEVAGPLAVLRSATSVNADLLGRPDLGRIAAGAVGDLLVLPGDPFTDPALLWTADRRTVIQAGTIRHQLERAG
jgi:imidazolonepropionase-like amidohydrolase